MTTSSLRDDTGLSTRHLLLIFLAGVAVCGVFFSLGFLVGYNERSGRMSPTAEQVATPATIPPTVNPPPETVPLGSTPATSIPSRVASPPAGSPPASAPKTASFSKAALAPARASAAPSAKGDQQSETDTTGRSLAGTAPAEGGFAVQVTAMRTKQDAEAVVRVLKGRGYPVFLVPPAPAPASDNLYRVQVGPFASRDLAEKASAKLKQQGFKPFIRH